MNCPLHLGERKDDTSKADGSALCRSKYVFRKGEENHVYHLFTCMLLNRALGGKKKKKLSSFKPI